MDELALIDTPLFDDDITLYVLHGLGPDYRDIVALIHTCTTSLTFEELHDMLVGHETYLKCLESATNMLIVTANPATRGNFTYRGHRKNFTRGTSSSQTRLHSSRDGFRKPKCQYCDTLGHTAKSCPKLSTSTSGAANFVGKSLAKDKKWLVDSGASHNITSDLSNLSIHSEYDGTDEVVIGDGKGLSVTYVGSLGLFYPSRSFHITNTLCVPEMHKNLISVHHFTKSNNVLIEFHPDYFFVKDWTTRAILLRGNCENGVYPLPPLAKTQSSIIANVGERTSTDTWHRRLGHPAQKIVSHIVKQFSLPLRNSVPPNNCTSCPLNKSHKLPFGTSSIVSHNPLEYIFSDVWGPTQIQSSDGYRYYVIFIDHYTRYCWFFPMYQKSDVYQIFTHLKPVLEKQFDHPIKNFYSDNGGEYIKLKTYFLNHGISHLTTPPHTPQHNGISERRHRHIVETGMTLLTQAALPTTYWPYAFQTAVYLINRLPSLALKYSSPYERLFGTSPNYLKLRTFGCLCFPWLKPYTGHKLDSKSRACIFLGYSTSQSAYKCLDLATSRLYLSRHVQFNENEFPSLCLKPPSEPIHTSPFHLGLVLGQNLRHFSRQVFEDSSR